MAVEIPSEFATVVSYFGAGGKTEPQVEEEVDLFGDDAAAAPAPAPKKVEPKKPKKEVIAKSSVALKAMPYDAELDITTLYEEVIKKIEMDGLIWGQPFTIVNGPFGLKGIQFGCVIEDAKVTLDMIDDALALIGVKEEEKEKYLELKRTGELEDYEEEWEGKKLGNIEVVSFQKI